MLRERDAAARRRDAPRRCRHRRRGRAGRPHHHRGRRHRRSRRRRVPARVPRVRQPGREGDGVRRRRVAGDAAPPRHRRTEPAAAGAAKAPLATVAVGEVRDVQAGPVDGGRLRARRDRRRTSRPAACGAPRRSTRPTRWPPGSGPRSAAPPARFRARSRRAATAMRDREAELRSLAPARRRRGIACARTDQSGRVPIRAAASLSPMSTPPRTADELRQSWNDFFAARGHTCRTVGERDPGRSHGALHRRGHGAVQALLRRRRDAAVLRVRCRSRSAFARAASTTTSTKSAARTGTSRSSR